MHASPSSSCPSNLQQRMPHPTLGNFAIPQQASTRGRTCWCSSSCFAASAADGSCHVSMDGTAASSTTKAATVVLNCSGSEHVQVMRTWGGGREERICISAGLLPHGCWGRVLPGAWVRAAALEQR